jgi:hypothetical protein
MKNFFGGKTSFLILGILAILAIMYLIASLGGLEFQPARPFLHAQESEAIAPAELPAWNGIGFVVVFFIAFLVILFFLLPPDQRKRFLLGILGFASAGLIIFLVIFRLFPEKSVVQQPPVPTDEFYRTHVPGPTETFEPMITPSVFTPPQISSLTSYLVALGILLVGVVGWVWLVWRKRKADAPLEVFAEIARSALGDIEAGRDWGDTILNSYYRMNQAVADWRGIHRQTGMTPAEFAAYLVSTHLPPQAVVSLTNLFERVRYGNKRSDPADIQEAVDCLTAIVEYCQAVK